MFAGSKKYKSMKKKNRESSEYIEEAPATYPSRKGPARYAQKRGRDACSINNMLLI